MTREARSTAEALLTSAEVARMAGVTRAAVSNWRRRYADFPQPAGGRAGSQLYPLAEIRAWLDRQRKGSEASGDVRLWQTLRAEYGHDMVAGVIATARLLNGDRTTALGAEITDLVDELVSESSADEVLRGLVERLLDAERRAGSDQITPLPLARALRHLAEAAADTAPGIVLDPACGTGTLLLTLASTGDPARTVLRGQDLDPKLAALTQTRARAAGWTDAEIEAGDSLRNDRWPELRADLVVCDPPSAAPDWGREQLLMDPRWELGTPSRAENELAWLQHCYAHTAPNGHTLIVMPTSVAYRKAGRRIRAELVRRGALAQVTALPGGMAAVHAQPLHVWDLRRPRSLADGLTHVRMVDLTANPVDGPWELRPDQVADVPLIDLLDDTVDLSPGSHVGMQHRDFPVEYAAACRDLIATVQELIKVLPQLDAGDGAGTLEGPTVSVADLARNGLVDLGTDLPASNSEQLDTDFLQGFLRSLANTRRSTSASGTFRMDVRGARIPQMPVEQQRRYGTAFRSLDDFEQRARRITELSAQALALAREGLGSGALRPPASEE
jgi:hypothetical protein